MRNMWRKQGETQLPNTLGNPNPTYAPNDPAKSENKPFEQTTKQPNTQVGSAQLSTAGRVAPDGPEPLDREVRPNTARVNPAGGEELHNGVAVDIHGV